MHSFCMQVFVSLLILANKTAIIALRLCILIAALLDTLITNNLDIFVQ